MTFIDKNSPLLQLHTSLVCLSWLFAVMTFLDLVFKIKFEVSVNSYRIVLAAVGKIKRRQWFTRLFFNHFVCTFYLINVNAFH